jgi:hypothetical protein
VHKTTYVELEEQDEQDGMNLIHCFHRSRADRRCHKQEGKAACNGLSTYQWPFGVGNAECVEQFLAAGSRTRISLFAQDIFSMSGVPLTWLQECTEHPAQSMHLKVQFCLATSVYLRPSHSSFQF